MIDSMSLLKRIADHPDWDLRTIGIGGDLTEIPCKIYDMSPPVHFGFARCAREESK
jgi:hypothetical protein